MTLLDRLTSPFFLAPINTGFAENGAPTDSLIAFHRERSGRGLALSYVGNAAIDSGYVTNPRTLVAIGDPHRWIPLVAAIHGAGSQAALQLACRAGARPANRQWRTADVDQLSAELCAISESELGDVIRSFRESAKFAANTGFDVIQVHGAHGYLISQSLNPWVNRRHDAYGTHALLLLEHVLDAVREGAPTCALDVRLSLTDGVVAEAEERVVRDEQLSIVAKSGVDMISLSAGMYEISRHQIYPSQAQGWGPYVPMARSLATSHPSIAWNVAGNIWHLPKTEGAVANLSYSIGRALIADPGYVEKEIAGLRSLVRACDYNGQCHYYTRGEPSLVCPVSDDLRPR